MSYCHSQPGNPATAKTTCLEFLKYKRLLEETELSFKTSWNKVYQPSIFPSVPSLRENLLSAVLFTLSNSWRMSLLRLEALASPPNLIVVCFCLFYCVHNIGKSILSISCHALWVVRWVTHRSTFKDLLKRYLQSLVQCINTRKCPRYLGHRRAHICPLTCWWH